MIAHISETIWLSEEDVCSLEHLVETSGLSADEIQWLVDAGVIVPANPDPKHYQFQMNYIILARTARRLRDDFDLDQNGLTVALQLLNRIHLLEQELKWKKR